VTVMNTTRSKSSGSMIFTTPRFVIGSPVGM